MRFFKNLSKEKIKLWLKKLLQLLFNPRLLLCLAIAWMITNGWSYVLLALGLFFRISWMQALAGAYLSLLWIPFTPEKILTVAIAIFLLRLFFPKDEKTLGVLRDMFRKEQNKHRTAKEKRKKRKIARKGSSGTEDEKKIQ